MQPGFIKHLLLIGQFELKRHFATSRGLLSLLTMTVVWIVILLYPLDFAAQFLIQGNRVLQQFRFFDFMGFDYGLPQWPLPEFEVFWHIALMILPLLSITLAADQTCSDRERGTLRFLLLRTCRERIFLGRFLGVLFYQVVIIGLTTFSVLGLVVYRDIALFSMAWDIALVVLVNLVLVILPFSALMAVLSALVKSVRQASVWAILIWTFLAGVISMFAHYVPVMGFLTVLVPGYQLPTLVQLAGWQTLQLAHLPLLQCMVLLAAGCWVMQRQAL